MVLSNKKLKQQIRAKFAEILISKTPDLEIQTNPETPKSLKQFLDSTTQKPRLSKREKRRENVSNGENKDTHVEGTSRGKKRRREKMGGEDGGGVELEVNENVGDSQNLSIKKKKKKKEKGKIDVGEKSGGDVEMGVKEGGDLSTKEKVPVKKNKKKKKMKKSKSKSKAKIEEVEKQSMIENGVLPEQIVAETSQGNEDDCKKVYVGGMPYSSTEDDMWNYFDHCGTITDIDFMKFPDTGKFRGIAIISFKTEEAAKKALALDGSDMDDLYLKIQPYKATRTTKSSDFTPPVIEGYNRIYAGNLSWDITEEDLRKLFSDCTISSIRFGEDKETGDFKGYAHVDFSDSDSLTKALKLDQKVVCGRPVKISRAVPGKGAMRNPGSAPAPPTVKPQENNCGIMPPAVKPEEKYSGVMLPAVEPEENYNEIMPPAVKPQENNSGVSSGKLKRRTCYECGERGHISSACPKKQATEQTVPNAS